MSRKKASAVPTRSPAMHAYRSSQRCDQTVKTTAAATSVGPRHATERRAAPPPLSVPTLIERVTRAASWNRVEKFTKNARK